MDERYYITVEEEKAQQAKNADAEGYPAFLRQWSIDEFPACDVGMRLLYAFALAQPAAFDLVKPRGFVADEPRLKNSPHWRAFADHVNMCPKCNEV
jgi:hypothetical protein